MEEAEVAELLEFGVGIPEAVQLAEQVFDVAGRVPVALFPLVLFAVEVLFFVWNSRIFAEFKA
ncbi:MAG: hypothetical protein RIS92_697 [Verrucomicrobiota bacterium]